MKIKEIGPRGYTHPWGSMDSPMIYKFPRLVDVSKSTKGETCPRPTPQGTEVRGWDRSPGVS